MHKEFYLCTRSFTTDVISNEENLKPLNYPTINTRRSSKLCYREKIKIVYDISLSEINRIQIEYTICFHFCKQEQEKQMYMHRKKMNIFIKMKMAVISELLGND